MQYYFAYGSNLHHAQMKRRCPKCRYIKKYILRDYQLTFRSKYGACDIENKIGKKVYGALYQISRPAEGKLDIYEEYPILYRKIIFGLLGLGLFAFLFTDYHYVLLFGTHLPFSSFAILSAGVPLRTTTPLTVAKDALIPFMKYVTDA